MDGIRSGNLCSQHIIEQAKTISRTFPLSRRHSIRKFENFSHSIFKLLLLVYVNTPKYFFRLIVPLKAAKILQSFPYYYYYYQCPVSQKYATIVFNQSTTILLRVRIVNDYAGTQFSKCLVTLKKVFYNLPCFSVVNDYADMISRISSRKQKNCPDRVCLFIWGPGIVF